MKLAAIVMLALVVLSVIGVGCTPQAFQPAPQEYRPDATDAAEQQPLGGGSGRMAIYTTTY
jgi:hypothetical protein